MSPAPYWGELPSEAVNARHRRSVSEQARRQPDDEDVSGSTAQQQPTQIGPKRAFDRPNRPNRISLQSTLTDTPTESTTMSPFATPIASTFTPTGLAPRPSSDRRSRRHPPLNIEDYEAVITSPPLLGHEVARAPSISYRLPYSDDAPLFAGGLPRPPGQTPTPPSNMDRLESDNVDDPLRRWASPGRIDSSTRALGPAPTRRDVYSGSESGNGGSAPSLKSPTVPSSSAESRQFAEGRSPLQKLEQQLKLEKRARMEAAEKRAREKSEKSERAAADTLNSGRAAQQSAAATAVAAAAVAAAVRKTELRSNNNNNQVNNSRDRQYINNATSPPFREADAAAVAVAPTSSRAPSVQMPDVKMVAASGPGTRQQPQQQPQKHPQQQPQQQQQLQTQRQPQPQAQAQAQAQVRPQPQRRPQQQNKGSDPGFPTRNPSFRERAASSNRQDLAEPFVNGETIEDSRYRDHQPGMPRPPPTRGQALQPPPTLTGERERGRERERDRDNAATGIRVPQSAVAATAAVAALTQMRGSRRRATEPIQHRLNDSNSSLPGPGGDAKDERTLVSKTSSVREGSTGAIVGRPRRPFDDEVPDVGPTENRSSKLMFDPSVKGPKAPGDGLYKPPRFLDEWRKGFVANLSGPFLDLSEDWAGGPEKEKAWWETSPSGARRSIPSRPRKAEAFDGEYDETSGVPTRFKPPLYLECGPLLRYCGIRHEKIPSRSAKKGVASERSVWRGTVMIVTRDRTSSYDIAPTLRLFLQPLDLLPPPPAEILGEEDLPPEYVDPIAGLPKLGRKGETLYVRPVEDLPEATDLSRDETLNGLFEPTRTAAPDPPPPVKGTEPPGSFASRRKRVTVDGESASKYKDVKGFRLHAEKGATFWRFNIEVELRDKQQRIAYRINRGPSTGFWVPAKGESMNVMFSSCNSFSRNVNSDEFCGPDPMWRDVLNTHQTRPFHVMIGGGDQIYNDVVMDECGLFKEWMDIRDSRERLGHPFTRDMQEELESFYLDRYCMWFSQGLFGLANSQIPMVNMLDDHDIFDGYGSYPHQEMSSAVMAGLGAVAFKYYMLFQHQSTPDETENAEPSWILGAGPGPYINERSRNMLMALGNGMSLLAVDCRTERNESEVVTDRTWEKIMNRCHDDIEHGETHHLLVLLGIPLAYPRLAWLENLLTSRLMNPIKTLGRTGIFGSALNKLDGGTELLDNINDHWTAKHHKAEREVMLQDLQDLAAEKLIRITILSGDVHLAAIGQFYSNPKMRIPKHADRRYIPNVISSAIANAPPPDILADIINRRDKIHHLDAMTDEDMIPMFPHGVDGNPRNNTHLLPHRNWCSIRPWLPGSTPPSTPPGSIHGRTPSPPRTGGGLGGIIRRLSSRRKPPPARSATALGPRPPPASGGFFRNLSRSRRNQEPSSGQQSSRSQSLSRAGSMLGGSRDRQPDRQPDDGGINGQWGGGDGGSGPLVNGRGASTAPRGAENREYDSGDEAAFTSRPLHRPRTQDDHGVNMSGAMPPRPQPFHRTSTQVLEQKRTKKAFSSGLAADVNLEGGLDICINAEVSRTDPAGITVPYRLLVPRLLWDAEEDRSEYDDGNRDDEGAGHAGRVGHAETAAAPPTVPLASATAADMDMPSQSQHPQHPQHPYQPQHAYQPQMQAGPVQKPPSRLFSLKKRQATF